MTPVRRRTVSTVIALTLGLHPLMARAAAPPPSIAGYVSAIDGRTGGCVIVRGKKEIPARYWADLNTGDDVVAKGECRIEIMPKDGPRRWTVAASNSPTPLTVKAQRQTPLPKMVETMGRALSQWNDDLQPPPPIRPASPKKGAPARQPVNQVALAPPPPPPAPPLALGLLSGTVRQRLFAAARRFNLAWTGGKPPFTVVLSAGAAPSPGAAPATDGPPWTFQVGEERVVSSMIAPALGVYAVRITDAAGTSVEGQFDAVEMPPIVDTRDFDTIPNGIARILAAARLANMDGGAWRMEAHARLSEMGRDDFAAALMAGRLRMGLDVPDPVPDAPGPSASAASGR